MAFKKAKKEMIALHPGSQVFVSKEDLVNIYTDKPALYTARLTGLVFGEKQLQQSKMPEEKLTVPSSLETLNSEMINSIIGKERYAQTWIWIPILTQIFTFTVHVMQLFKKKADITKQSVRKVIRTRVIQSRQRANDSKIIKKEK